MHNVLASQGDVTSQEMTLPEGVHTKEGHQPHAKSVVSEAAGFHRTACAETAGPCVSALYCIQHKCVRKQRAQECDEGI